MYTAKAYQLCLKEQAGWHAQDVPNNAISSPILTDFD